MLIHAISGMDRVAFYGQVILKEVIQIPNHEQKLTVSLFVGYLNRKFMHVYAI